MGGLEQTGFGGVDQAVDERALGFEVNVDGAGAAPVADGEILARAERRGGLREPRAEQQDDIALAAECGADSEFGPLQQAEHADDGCGQDGAVVGFVIERSVAAHDRRIENAAGVADPANGFAELEVDRRALGVGEVETIGNSDRPRADAGDIAGRLGHSAARAGVRVELDRAAGTVGADGQRMLQAANAQHRRVGAGRNNGIGPHLVVVLPPDPALGGNIGRSQQLEQRGLRFGGIEVGQRRGVEGGPLDGIRIALGRRLIRRRVGEDAHGRGSDFGTAVHDAGETVRCHFANHRGIELPFGEPGGDILDMFRLHGDDHSLLGFGKHHLVGRHAALAAGHAVGMNHNPDAGALGHLDRRAGNARRAAVLQTLNPVAVLADEADAGVHQQLFEEWIADLHGGPALHAGLVEFDAGEGRPVQPVAPRIRADQHQLAAGRAGAGRNQLLAARDAQAHRVDQRIARILRCDDEFAAHGGDAETVAVAADAGDHAGAEPPVARIIKRPEAQRVEQRDGLRAHRENVAHNPADARRRALIRLNRAGVVVRFDLHHRHPAAANLDRPGVLVAERGEDVLALGGKVVKQRAGVLVAAVLAPERADHAQLNLSRRALKQLAGADVFIAAERDLRQRLVVNRRRRVVVRHRQPQRSMIERQIRLPSSPPSSGSEARSGCGIMPSTLPCSLSSPAMSCSEPLGLASLPTAPSASQ